MRARREEQRLIKWRQENDAAREAEAKRLVEEGTSGHSTPHASWPPPTNHAAVSACLTCGSDDLVETRDSAIMMTVKDRPDASYVDYPTLVNLVICRRCGRMEMFANDTSAFLSAYQHGKQTQRSLPGVPFPNGAPPPWAAGNAHSGASRDGSPAHARESESESGSEPTAAMAPVAVDPEPRKTRYRRRATDADQETEALPAPVPAAEAKPKARRTTRRIEKLDH